MGRKNRKPKKAVYCNPDICDNCQYIGEGDSYCDVTREIVLEDWKPTEHFMGTGCPYQGEELSLLDSNCCGPCIHVDRMKAWCREFRKRLCHSSSEDNDFKKCRECLYMDEMEERI